jgi:NADH-quinone oxidoreductase subunit E
MGMDTAVQKRPLDEVVASYPANREHLISILQEVQAEYGYLSKDSINRISGYLNLPSSKVFGVATFYNQFRLNAPGRIQIQVCRGTACHVKGSLNLLESLKTLLGIDVGETTKDGLFSLETVACLGCCSIAPAMMVNGRFFGRLDKKTIEDLVDKFRSAGRGEA